MCFYFVNLHSFTKTYVWYACILFHRACIILIGMNEDCCFMQLRNLIFYALTLGNAYLDTTFDDSPQRPSLAFN
jgi:hypothetical protein